jgi:hypothetical protein
MARFRPAADRPAAVLVLRGVWLGSHQPTAELWLPPESASPLLPGPKAVRTLGPDGHPVTVQPAQVPAAGSDPCSRTHASGPPDAAVCDVDAENRETCAELVLIARPPVGQPPAETARLATITQIYEGTNQIQRVVMARQLLKG